MFPPDISCLADHCGGSGAILLGTPKCSSRLDIYNDYDVELTNFFLCVRDRPLALIRELSFFPLQSEAEFTFLKDYRYFVVGSHPAVLDGFVTRYREAYQALGLFNPEQCEPKSFSTLDYKGKVLVLSPEVLKESCWTPQAQLWYAHDGFGCSPTAIGRSIRCTCLGDGEQTRWERTDFIGMLKEEFLPEWAEEKLAVLRGPEQAQEETQQGMTMG